MDHITLFSETTSLYFFSALLQANAALIAIIGVFWIFRIRSYQSGIDIIKSTLSIERGVSSTMEVDPTLIVTFEKMSVNKKRTYIETEEEDDRVKLLLTDWTNKEEQINDLKSEIKSPTIFMAIGIIISGIGLLASNIIHELGPITELILLLLVLIYQIVIVYIIIKIIFYALDIKVQKKTQHQS